MAVAVDFSRLRVVLVATSHPGNIGAAARAMKTMGLGRLVLVAPKQYPCAEATARASGADDILYRAEVVNDLDAALAGVSVAYGVTARRRGISSEELLPRDCARAVTAQPHGEAALVFGNERSGLSNDELDRCQYLVRIPANPDYGSLNLAAAVQVLAYELRIAALDGAADQRTDDPRSDSDKAKDEPATADDMERFYQHLQQVLLEVEFINPDNPRHLMRRLRRLFNRARPDQREVSILRGILAAVQRRRRDDR